MLGDLLRPSNPTFIANGQDVLSNENSRFTVRFPDGETLVATPGQGEGVAFGRRRCPMTG